MTVVHDYHDNLLFLTIISRLPLLVEEALFSLSLLFPSFFIPSFFHRQVSGILSCLFFRQQVSGFILLFLLLLPFVASAAAMVRSSPKLFIDNAPIASSPYTNVNAVPPVTYEGPWEHRGSNVPLLFDLDSTWSMTVAAGVPNTNAPPPAFSVRFTGTRSFQSKLYRIDI